jgi:hypothetical protein
MYGQVIAKRMSRSLSEERKAQIGQGLLNVHTQKMNLNSYLMPYEKSSQNELALIVKKT